MGSPTSKAECDREIARIQKELEDAKLSLARAKEIDKRRGYSAKSMISSSQGRICMCKQKLADLRALRKTLKS